MRFKDREDAGRQMAKALKKLKGEDVVILALPRGGIVPAAEIAGELEAPLDVVLVRKIGHPFSPEYAVGAVVLDKEPVLNDEEVKPGRDKWVDRAVAEEQAVNKLRYEKYYEGRAKPVPLKDKSVIVVDDGIATGLTMEAVVKSIKQEQPKRIVVAVPVAPPDSATRLRKMTDDVLVLDDTENFLGAVGAHYDNFTQVDDSEVVRLLEENRANLGE